MSERDKALTTTQVCSVAPASEVLAGRDGCAYPWRGGEEGHSSQRSLKGGMALVDSSPQMAYKMGVGEGAGMKIGHI